MADFRLKFEWACKDVSRPEMRCMMQSEWDKAHIGKSWRVEWSKICGKFIIKWEQETSVQKQMKEIEKTKNWCFGRVFHGAFKETYDSVIINGSLLRVLEAQSLYICVWMSNKGSVDVLHDIWGAYCSRTLCTHPSDIVTCKASFCSRTKSS